MISSQSKCRAVHTAVETRRFALMPGHWLKTLDKEKEGRERRLERELAHV
jgi:hypothetical protein